MLFLGDEYDAPSPFLYFVSHSDRDLVAAVRKGRHEEFASFGWAGDVPDPQSEETFARSRIHYELRSEGEHAALREMYRELLAIRREEPALRPGAARISVESDSEARWVAMRLEAPGARTLLALFNLSRGEARIPLRHDSGEWKQWTRRFATKPHVTAGPEAGAGAPFVNMPPLSAALFSLHVD
jgi:maltooligosyltrehalose trehalohydrolase